MKKAFSFVLCSIAVGIGLIILVFIEVVAAPGNVFKDNFINTLSDKYETLVNTDSPKIIIVAGSSASFSLDGNRLADMTGMRVANTALNAGIGALYEAELSKANIDEGDIVLLGYEWGYVTDSNYTNSFGTDTIMVGIDEKLDMYKYVPPSKYKDVLGYLFTFANDKRTYAGGAQGVYSRSAFSENGNTMEFQRDDSPIIYDYEENPDRYGSIHFENPIIPDSTVEYFKDYKQYVESKGASVYWIGCPTYEAAIKCDYDELVKAANQVESQIGITYISNPVDYIFPGEYMYDTIYHTNTFGMEYRTNLLFDDLKRAGIL